jgi:two-component system sensor histidine kinase DesK
MTESAAYTTEKAARQAMQNCEKIDWSDYVWLAYSVFFFIEPVVRNNPRYWLECVALFVVFLAVYIGTVHSRQQRQQLLLIGAMAVLGAIGFSFNLGATCFFTFAAAFLPFSVASVGTVVACIVGGEIFIFAEAMLIHADWMNTGIGLFLVAIVGTGNIFFAQKRNANARLSMAQDEIERLAALAERERIARDMHDVLGHTLSVIALKSELARRLLEAEEPNLVQARLEIAEVETTARVALTEVRQAIVGYRAEGLAAEIDSARRTLRSAGAELSFDATAELSTLSATEETVLSLAVREAVTNIVRHTQATACVIRLERTADGVHTLVVEDNGRAGSIREGNGLRGMRERVESLGGRLGIESNGPVLGGTALRIELPGSRRPAPASLRSASQPLRSASQPLPSGSQPRALEHGAVEA